MSEPRKTLRIRIEGDRGSGKTTLSAIIEQALVAAGYTTETIEMQGGKPLPKHYQRHMAACRREPVADLEPGRPVAIVVENQTQDHGDLKRAARPA